MTSPIGAHYGRLTLASDPGGPPAGADAGEPPDASATTDDALGPVDDVMSQMYVAMANAQQSDLAAGTGQVAVNQNAIAQARAAQQAALDQARANQSDSGGGFFGCIEKFVGDLVSDLGDGKFGTAVQDAERNAAAAWNSPKFWSDLETAAADVATVGEVAAKIPIPVIQAIGVAVAVNATVVKAAAGLRESHFQAAAQDATADATDASNHADQLHTAAKDLVADIQETNASHAQALDTIAQAIDINDQSLVAAASMHVQG